KKDITPDFPVPLAGYQAKDRFSEGIHDRLYARCLAFTGGTKPVVLLHLDLLFPDGPCVDRIRKNIEPLGLTKDNLLVCSTHTHSGYGGFLDTGKGLGRALLPLNGAFDEKIAGFLDAKCREAVTEALDNSGADKTSVSVRMNRGKITGLAANRRDPALPCDDDLFVMEFFREDGKKILVYNLSCHPTVLNGANRLISADIAGAAAALLERGTAGEAGPGFPAGEAPYDLVLFINGSAGDMSTRFTRKGSGFAECERFGALIRDAVAELSGGGFEALEDIRLEYHRVDLKSAKIPDRAGAEGRLAETRKNLEKVRAQTPDPGLVRKAESLVEGAEVNLLKALYAEPSGETIPVETGILGVNGQTIVCSPFELFSSLALGLKTPDRRLELFGYVNAVKGYLADTDAYDAMEYEALFSEFARGEGERYIEILLGVTAR
ncbi:MAG: neutral/alkaline non-lysosomal ceramidase N-terminal domain-containing protein, partial [Treponema sp.]|nr:neutral/alkaline non-lysosomal ceramidase N-terminal domain-containing protein [Treponema sp.]